MRNKKTIALAMAAATVAPMAVPAFAAEEKAITQSPIAAGSVARYGLEDLNNRKIKRVSKENLAEEIRSLQAQNKEPKVVYREVKSNGSFGDALVQYNHDRVAEGEVSATTMAAWKAQFAEAKSFIEYANSKNAVDGNTGAKLYNVSVKEEDYKLTDNGFINNKKIVTVTENVDSNNNKTLDTFTFVFEAFDTTFKGEEVVVKTIADIDLTTANNVEAQYKRLAAVEYNLKKSLKNNTGLVVTTNKEEVQLTSNKKGFKYTVNIFKADAVTKVGQFVVYTPESGIDKTKVVAQPKVTNDFSGHWAEESIVNAMLNGIVTTTETFNPKTNITRAEFAAVIYNTLESEGKLNKDGSVPAIKDNKNKNIKFSDVATKDWFAEPVMALAKAGYLNGNPDGTFKPNAPISREEAAKIMSDVINKKTQETYKVDANGVKHNVDIKTKFADDNTIANWADESVQYLVEKTVTGSVINSTIKGTVISGDAGKNTFRGKDSISRAEAIIMAERAGIAVR